MMAIVDDHMRAYERELVLDKDPMFAMFKAAPPVLTREVACYDGYAARADLKQIATAIDALKRAAMPRITREQAIDEAVRLCLSMKAMRYIGRLPDSTVPRGLFPRRVRDIRAEFARIMAPA